jgi:hypothetical protein
VGAKEAADVAAKEENLFPCNAHTAEIVELQANQKWQQWILYAILILSGAQFVGVKIFDTIYLWGRW